MNIVVSEQLQYTKPEQLTNKIDLPSNKWFSLQDNILDGSFKLLGPNVEGEVGWWGTEIADAEGNLSSQPTVTIDGWIASVFQVRVVGDKLLDQYPVDYDIRLYNGKQLLGTFEVRGADSVDYIHYLDNVYETTKIELQFYKVNKPNRSLKILEIDTPEPNIGDLMDAPERRIVGRVQITYTDTELDDSIDIEASETGRFTYPKQTADNVTSIPYKMFSLHENKLDGTYKLLPANQEFPVGWWSSSLSDSDGYFTNPPKIVVSFESRPVHSLSVYGDNALLNYPVDFTISLFGENGDLLHEEVVIGNRNIHWYKNIVPVPGVVTASLSIHRINKPNSASKVLEFFTLVQETYYDDDIQSIALLEELEHPTGTVSLGNVSSNEIDIILSNEDERFTQGNTQSPLHNLLKKGRPVKAWLGVEVVDNVFWWKQLGQFWTSSWKISDSSLEVAVTARDRLEQMRATTFENSQNYYNKSLYELFEIILVDYGLKNTEYEISPELKDIVIPLAWFDRVSHREALQHLAGCALVNIYCNRAGKVVIKNVWPTVYTIKEDLNTLDGTLSGTEISPTNGLVLQSGRLVGTKVTVLQLDHMDVIGKSNLTYIANTPPGTEIQTEISTNGTDWVYVENNSELPQLRHLNTSDIKLYIRQTLLTSDPDITPEILSTIIHIEGYRISYRFDEDKNIFGRSFPLEWSQVTNSVEIDVTSFSRSENQPIIDISTSLIIPAGETTEVLYHYTSLPVENVSEPIIDKDPDISYTYQTYAWGAKIQFTNNGIQEREVRQITFVGDVLYPSTSGVVVYQDPKAIAEDGIQKTVLSHVLIQSSEYAKRLASIVLSRAQNAQNTIQIDSRGNIALELGDCVTSPSHLQNVTSPYMVTRQRILWDGSLQADVTGTLL